MSQRLYQAAGSAGPSAQAVNGPRRLRPPMTLSIRTVQKSDEAANVQVRGQNITKAGAHVPGLRLVAGAGFEPATSGL